MEQRNTDSAYTAGLFEINAKPSSLIQICGLELEVGYSILEVTARAGSGSVTYFLCGFVPLFIRSELGFLFFRFI